MTEQNLVEKAVEFINSKQLNTLTAEAWTDGQSPSVNITVKNVEDESSTSEFLLDFDNSHEFETTDELIKYWVNSSLTFYANHYRTHFSEEDLTEDEAEYAAQCFDRAYDEFNQ